MTAAEVCALVAGRDVRLVALDLADASSVGPRPTSSALVSGDPLVRRSDSSQKRNLGLLLARLVGWQRVMFLDDDICDVVPSDVQRAAGLLVDFHAVGLANDGYPDNSVVCHAHRDVGGSQSQFIGAGALLVSSSDSRSFFPHIYNADWLYLVGESWPPRVAVAGRMNQRVFDPFAVADRARSEEFGECIAEGLYWLLDEGRPLEAADIAYWARFLRSRRQFIMSVTMRVRQCSDSPVRMRMLDSLRAARVANAAITPGLCMEFVERWLDDLATWRRFIDNQPTGLGLDQALVELGLDRVAYRT